MVGWVGVCRHAGYISDVILAFEDAKLFHMNGMMDDQNFLGTIWKSLLGNILRSFEDFLRTF